VLHVEAVVSGAPCAAVLTRGGGRVSHSHGISLTARRSMVSRLAAREGSKGPPA